MLFACIVLLCWFANLVSFCFTVQCDQGQYPQLRPLYCFLDQPEHFDCSNWITAGSCWIGLHCWACSGANYCHCLMIVGEWGQLPMSLSSSWVKMTWALGLLFPFLWISCRICRVSNSISLVSVWYCHTVYPDRYGEMLHVLLNWQGSQVDVKLGWPVCDVKK